MSDRGWMTKGIVLIRSIVDLQGNLDAIVNRKDRSRVSDATCCFDKCSVDKGSLVKPPSVNCRPVFVGIVGDDLLRICLLQILKTVLVRVAVCRVHICAPAVKGRRALGNKIIIMGRLKRGVISFVVIILQFQQRWTWEEC